MTLYCVYEPPREPSPGSQTQAGLEAIADKVSFIKDGFSWPALFVPILWLIYQRMWLELLAFLVVFTSVPMFFGNDPAMKALGGWVSFGLLVVFAFEANDLRGWALMRRGFTLSGTASGRDREEAEIAFFSRWLPQQERAGRENGPGFVPPVLPAKVAGSKSVPAQFSTGDEVIGSFPKG